MSAILDLVDLLITSSEKPEDIEAIATYSSSQVGRDIIKIAETLDKKS